jgi:hypothetical protein
MHETGLEKEFKTNKKNVMKTLQNFFIWSMVSLLFALQACEESNLNEKKQ